MVKPQHCAAFYQQVSYFGILSARIFFIITAAQDCQEFRSYLATNLDESSFEDTKIEVRTYARLRIVECRSSMRTFTVI